MTRTTSKKTAPAIVTEQVPLDNLSLDPANANRGLIAAEK
jgi:hypothetical protein